MYVIAERKAIEQEKKRKSVYDMSAWILGAKFLMSSMMGRTQFVKRIELTCEYRETAQVALAGGTKPVER